MELILASDIFGRTPEFESLAAELSSGRIKTTILDPYSLGRPEFKNEKEAYAYFQNNVGHTRYKDIVAQAVRGAGFHVMLIGFSVGASAIWLLSDEMPSQVKWRAVCFYGSQIRNMLEVEPRIRIDLIFPKHEEHFKVVELISHLADKEKLTCTKVSYLHGFMNQRSKNFDQRGYDHYVRHLKKMIA